MCAVSTVRYKPVETVTGVIPHFMVEQNWCQGLTDLVEVDSMHERKQRITDLDAAIALPGGCALSKNCWKSSPGNS